MPPDYRVIRARSNSPADIARAQVEAARGGTWGLCGPINPAMILIPYSIPYSRHGAQPRATQHRADRFNDAVRAQNPLDAIRRHPYAIGGYATPFNVVSDGAQPLRIHRGAFAAAIAARSMFLLLDHPDAGETPSLASMSKGTLHAEEDAYGLWFEAALEGDAGRRAHCAVRCGAIAGMSWGSVGSVSASKAGVREITALDAWELSLITAPSRPRFSGTWVLPNAEAHRRRAFYRN